MNESLKSLDIGNNQIESLTETGIENLSRLEYLSLYNNTLKSLPKKIFSKMNNSLIYINIRSNQIESIEPRNKTRERYLHYTKLTKFTSR